MNLRPPAVACCLLAGLFVLPANAQAPSITSASPQAVRPGETTVVTLRGGNLKGATGLWSSFPAEAELAPEVKNNGQDNSRVVFRVTTPAEAPAGIHAVRVVTERGVSPLRLFLVDDLPSVAQKSGNTTRSQAQEVPVPCAVDGRLGNLTRHYYRFQVKAGQRLSFEVVARRMGSALDPMIRLLDSAGREITYSDDELGLQADSRICHTFSEAGEYTLELRDIRYQGGGNYFYRLRIGDFPCVNVPYPMGAQRGTQATLNFAGRDVENAEPVSLDIPKEPDIEWLTLGARRKDGSASGFAVLAVGDREFAETEPNNAPKKANRVELGTNLNGRFEKPHDVDRFVFAAKKGQRFTFEGHTRRQGAPTDLVLRLVNGDGKQLARSDDTGRTDARITQRFPADGDYTLIAEDLHARGGPQFAYRIDVAPTQNGFSLAASADRLNLPAGGVAAVTVTADRSGYNGPIEVAAADLPEGATSVPTVIGPKQKQVVLTVKGSKNMPAGELFPVRIVGRTKIGGNEYETSATIGGALRAANNDMPWPPPHLARAVAVAASPRPALALRTEPAEAVFGKNLKATVKITAERQKGWNQKIDLAVIPDPKKEGLPGGVTAQVKPIPEKKNEAQVVFSANNKAPLGEFTAVLRGTLKKGKQTVRQTAPGIRLKLQEPFSMQVDPGDGMLKRGGKLALKVRVKRNPALSGPIELTLENLPKGVSAKKTTLPAGKNEIEIPLSAAKDAEKGTAGKVTVKGTAKAGKATLSTASPAVKLAVN